MGRGLRCNMKSPRTPYSVLDLPLALLDVETEEASYFAAKRYRGIFGEDIGFDRLPIWRARTVLVLSFLEPSI